MLITILSTSALSVTIASWKTQIRTRRTEVHEAGEGDDPKVPGVDHVAAVELEREPALGTWAGERIIGQRTDQKTIG